MVDEIYDKWAACKMGIEEKGQICVMIHSGSRGFGHQVATGNISDTKSLGGKKHEYILTLCRRCARPNGESYEARQH